MSPPIRCFTCGRPTNGSWFTEPERLRELGYPEKEILDMFGIEKECCRVMVLTYVEEH